MMMGAVRDLLIIFLALTSIVVWVLLGILIWQIWRLTRLVQQELKPMIADTKETIATVRGTAQFMSENVVAPVIQTSSKFAGYRRMMQALVGNGPLRRTTPPRDGDAASAFTSSESTASSQTSPSV
ncbi:MAG: hypothetical protein NZ553_03405 [Caldilinea sp.]|nr:hypothetical protein [Caldilinea sp.]MDW8439498.1 hypothetical protein [Caldilineaceae bacterium]